MSAHMAKRIAKIFVVAAIAVTSVAYSFTGSIDTAGQATASTTTVVAPNPLFRVAAGR